MHGAFAKSDAKHGLDRDRARHSSGGVVEFDDVGSKLYVLTE